MAENKWDKRFLDMADMVASWSKDPSTKVGCVIVRPDRTIASVGFNGFPRRVQDAEERYADRNIKYAFVVHAEANAILAAKEPLTGMVMYCTLPPCSTCAGFIIQSGIRLVVARAPSPDQMDRWKDSIDLSKTMLYESQVAFEVLGL